MQIIFFLKQFFLHIKSNKFISNTFTLISGNFIAQIIPFLFAPVITRLYTPEDFAVLGIITSMITILVVLANGRYEMAIMLPKMERKSVELTHAGFIIAFILMLITLLGIHVFKNFIGDFLKLNKASEINLVYTVPLFIFAMGLYNPLNYWMIRIKKFTLISVGKVVQFASLVFFVLLLGYYDASNGLVIGYLISWIFFVLFTVYQCYRQNYFTYSINIQRVWQTAKKYKDFPLFNSLSALLVVVAQTMAVFFIQRNFLKEDTGYYSQLRQYVLAPISLISIAISQAFMQDIGLKIRQKVSVISFVKKLFIYSLMIGFVIIVLVQFIAPELFRIVFGNEWRTSGVFLQILIFSYIIQTIITPFGNIIHLLNKTKHTLIFPLIYVSSLLVYFWFSPKDIYKFLIGLTIIECAVYLLYFLLSYYLLKKFEKKITHHA